MSKKYFSKTGVTVICILILLLFIPIGVLLQNPLAIKLVKKIDNYQCRFVTSGPYSFRGPYVENCHWQWQCQNIDNSLGQSYCYTEIANKKNDKTICEKIEDESLKKACLKSSETQ